jgi:serine/threonine protein kinase
MLSEVIGSYRVLRQLGAGGMGVVYLAQHTVIGRHAAIKLLLPQYSADPEIVGRFFNEARTAALIRHPGLVDVYDFGRLPDGSAYLVMEYLTGETLASMLARHGRLPEELALALARQIAGAVGAAHHKGIVHRDLKPDNIFVVQDEEVPVGMRARILDFGIAKLSVELAEHGVKTRTGSFIGTPVYMSPEQCRGARTVDGRMWRIAGIASAGAGVVLLAGGVYFGLRAKSKSDQVDELQRGDMWDQDLYDSGKAAERNMFIFLGVGVAAVATGAVLYFVVGKPSPVETAVVPAPGGAGLVVSGEF